MTRRRPLLIAVFALPLLLLAVPAQAQQADSSASDTSATDTTQVSPEAADTSATTTDSAQATPTDTTTANTPTPADTTQSTAATDTTAKDQRPAAATDSTALSDSVATAADSVAADTALSAADRRARAKKQAQDAATSWLSLTDAGRFGESWDAAAASLQNGISRDAWMTRGTKARSTLDSLTSRTLTRVQYRDSTAQLPTGNPVVSLQYRSEFEGGSVLEAVITTKQDDTWKVAGYRIVPAPAAVQSPDSTATSADSTSADSTSQQ